MADQEPQAVVAADPQQPQQQPPVQGESLLNTITRFLMWFMVAQMVMSFIFPKSSTPKNELHHQNGEPKHRKPSDLDFGYNSEDNAGSLGPTSQQQQTPQNVNDMLNSYLGVDTNNLKRKTASFAPNILPDWVENQEGTLTYYLVENNGSETAIRDPELRKADTTIKLHTFESVKMSDEDTTEQKVNVTIPTLEGCAKRNCTLYLHAYLAPIKKRSTRGLDPLKLQGGSSVGTASMLFVRFNTVRKRRLVKLFGNSDAKNAEDEQEGAVEEIEIKPQEKQQKAETQQETSSSRSAFEKSFMSEEQIERQDSPSSSSSSEKALATASPISDDGDYITYATIPSIVTVNLVSMPNQWAVSNIPPVALPHMHPVPGNKNFFAPVLFVNEFWTLDEHRKLFNASNASTYENVNLTLTTYPLSQMKFLLYTSIQQQQESQQAWGLQSKSSMDDIKRMFIETEPWLLAVTFSVSILHSVFEYLTFKNDVSFWRGKKNFRGMSLRTVGLNCYNQLIIFLYLFDGNQTSYTILVPSGIGVLIEFWKLSKTFRIVKNGDEEPETENDASKAKQIEEGKNSEKEGTGKEEENAKKGENETAKEQSKEIVAASPNATVAVASKIVDAPSWQLWKHYTIRSHSSYDSTTRSFDEQAMRYLFYALTPCLIGYSIYSAVYDEHKGWYSFLISTQVRFIYWTGFVHMTPQIFINYKKKSVGGLPWRAFVYKALNTFIDDLFAFVIKMPTMHRLAVFRDDIVFIILLYQRWIYPVDENRSEMEQG